MAEFNNEVLHSERLRNSILAWVPEPARIHGISFYGHYLLKGDAEVEFKIGYDPDDSEIDLDVFERSGSDFFTRRVAVDTETGEIYTYSASIVDKNMKPKNITEYTEEFIHFLGGVKLDLSTLNVENEEYFLAILNQPAAE